MTHKSATQILALCTELPKLRFLHLGSNKLRVPGLLSHTNHAENVLDTSHDFSRHLAFRALECRKCIQGVSILSYLRICSCAHPCNLICSAGQTFNLSVLVLSNTGLSEFRQALTQSRAKISAAAS